MFREIRKAAAGKAKPAVKAKKPRLTWEQKVANQVAQLKADGASVLVSRGGQRHAHSITARSISSALIRAAVEMGLLVPVKGALFDEPNIPPQQYVVVDE